MKKILVVGSVGIDDIETPHGKVERVPGGSAVYFSLAASMFAPVNFVGVAGTDFPKDVIELMAGRGIDLKGLEIAEGKTFRWSGRYHDNMDTRDSLLTELNVFETFSPKLPDEYKSSEILFLANIKPELQLEVLSKMNRPELIISDTMNFWINNNPAKVVEVIRKSDIFIINDSELSLMIGEPNFLACTDKLLEECTLLKAIVVKLGKYGVYATDGKEDFFLPAFPLRKVVDPTGAGDSFAGGFAGHLAKTGDYSFENIRKACVYGSVTASYSVNNFSIKGLKEFDLEDILEEYDVFKKLTVF
jgi:sugar/nucleoside kinase (ribokinase family)